MVDDDDTVEFGGLVAASPGIMQHVEDAKSDGLPVIPFPFPTSVMAERMKNKHRHGVECHPGEMFFKVIFAYFIGQNLAQKTRIASRDRLPRG